MLVHHCKTTLTRVVPRYAFTKIDASLTIYMHVASEIYNYVYISERGYLRINMHVHI